MWRVIRRSLYVLSIPTAYVGYVHRPRTSSEKEYHEGVVGRVEDLSTTEKAFMGIGRSAVLTVSAVATWVACRIMNSTEVVHGDEAKLQQLINSQPLVTIVNHRSVYDDLVVCAELSPLSTLVDANKFRWNVCSEELCFKLHPAVSTYFGFGKVIPIQRGAGLYQGGMARLGKLMELGSWVQIHPEGRVWQEGGLPLRDAEGRQCSPSGRCSDPGAKTGPFKWGVGKLIANSPLPPIVVPVFQLGMEHVVPQGGDNNVVSWLPRTGKAITIKVGPEVQFDDLIDAYHAAALTRAMARAKHREATRVSPPAAVPLVVDDPDNAFDVPKRWSEPTLRITPPDHALLTREEHLIEEEHRRDLYAAITQRCFVALRDLEGEVREHRRRRGLGALDDAMTMGTGPTPSSE